jgi:photosystem II stability/assembly factor-like uncharacterized protein
MSAVSRLNSFRALLIGACLCPGLVYGGDDAGYAVDTVHMRTAHDSLFDVHFEGERGWAVGDYGLILMTTDAGRIWQAHPTATDSALLAIDMTRAGEGSIVGQEGIALHSADGGASWIEVRSGIDERLFSVSLNESGLGFAVGEFGALVRTRDHGRSWVSIAPDLTAIAPGWSEMREIDDNPHLYDVLVDDKGRVLVVGELGLILRSGDSGSTWTVVHRGAESLFAIVESPAGGYWCMGQSGLLLRSRDEGRSWRRIELDTAPGLLDMSIDAEGRGVLVGLGTVLFTDAGGERWDFDSDARFPAPWYQAIAAAGDGSLVVVGAYGSILRLQHRAALK